ncbi:transcriptional regulator [Aquibacillus koreensis]|uniref:HTH-type transcriptional regulator n=1 Tax=Aquibacillus koreensis TaxID=279446 RepID=A0A9X3WMR2_9BACI|nr:MarR family transcriptional regulator [Aquibacillus koreensis]MCT2535564.1 transcriptional regulator [Aquibacillus koreensis]MDC3420151.1 transcriptional regulator [Aquibacillus koreensis]
MSENQLENIHNLIVSEFAKTVEMFDISPSEARLFAILYIEGTPMTLDQMSDALGKSKTVVSTGIRNLVDQNLVERVWRKGVRKDLYMADAHLYRKFMNTYIHKWIDATSRQKQSLKEIELMLKEDFHTNSNGAESKEIDTLYTRIKDMITFHQSIEHAFKEIKPIKQS